MKTLAILCLSVTIFTGCNTQRSNDSIPEVDFAKVAKPTESYTERKKVNLRMKARLREKPTAYIKLITDYWVASIGDTMYKHWSGTAWDFNGVTTIPKEGYIACGYFVTTVLKDMGMPIDRVKLAVCASSEMMKALTPGQKFINLSASSMQEMQRQLLAKGKGVYIIGLDFHTGFIVVDDNDV